MENKVIFGEKIKDKNYITREGAYALILEKNKIAIIKTSTGYFLPGGGIDNNENHGACLKREAREEMGWEIKINKLLGNAGRYFYSTNQFDYYFSDGYFYLAEKIKVLNNNIEDDHETVWLALSEALDKLFHEHQAWAVKKEFELNK